MRHVIFDDAWRSERAVFLPFFDDGGISEHDTRILQRRRGDLPFLELV